VFISLNGAGVSTQSADDMNESLCGASPTSTEADGSSPRAEAFLDRPPAAATGDHGAAEAATPVAAGPAASGQGRPVGDPGDAGPSAQEGPDMPSNVAEFPHFQVVGKAHYPSNSPRWRWAPEQHTAYLLPVQ
jgi:hypothetical protein